MTCLLSFEDTLSLRHSGTSLSFLESSFHLSWSRSMAGTSISSPVSSPQFYAEVRALVSSSMLDVSSECLLCVPWRARCSQPVHMWEVQNCYSLGPGLSE